MCACINMSLFIVLMRLSDASGAGILGEETTRSRSTCQWIAKCQGNYNLSYVHTCFFCFVAKHFLLWFSSSWNELTKIKCEISWSYCFNITELLVAKCQTPKLLSNLSSYIGLWKCFKCLEKLLHYKLNITYLLTVSLNRLEKVRDKKVFL